jgi:hypothetical protein
MIADLYINCHGRDLAMRLSRPYRGFHGDIIDTYIANAFHEEILEQHSQSHYKVQRETAEETK